MPRPPRAAVLARRADPAASAAAVALAVAIALVLGLLAAREAVAAETATAPAAGDATVERDPGREWAVGRPLPDADAARPLEDPAAHGLSPTEAGERYVVYKGEVLKVSGTPEAGLIVLSSAGEAAAILD